MANDLNSIEFEVSFNFHNVLYIAQVTALQDGIDNYYSVVYFSPNEKGEIPKLLPADGSGGWREANPSHDSAFIAELGKQIQLRNDE